MTPIQLAGRLRALAGQKPTHIWRELHALAADIQHDAELDAALQAQAARRAAVDSAAVDIEALARIVTPPTTLAPNARPRRRWWR